MIIIFLQRVFSLFFAFFLIINICFSQAFLSVSDSLNSNRRDFLYGTYIIGTSTSYLGLYNLWYKEKGMSDFSFYNDNRDWLQLDKAGHIVSTYHIGYISIQTLKWAGLDSKKASIQGGISSLVYMTGIEIMDGFADEYGFSIGDALANAVGIGALITQEFLWNDQKIRFKHSYFPSQYSKYRPELLGNNYIQGSLKDYNGITFWMSYNLESFLNTGYLPKCLNIAFGYSGDGLLGGSENPKYNNQNIELFNYNRTRQFLLSLDIDLTKIETNSKILKTIFSTFGFIKIPFPAIEYNSNKEFIFYGIYL
jgi:hypothetical protein